MVLTSGETAGRIHERLCRIHYVGSRVAPWGSWPSLCLLLGSYMDPSSAWRVVRVNLYWVYLPASGPGVMSRGPRTGVFLLEDAWRGGQVCLRSAGQELPRGIAGIEAMRYGPFRAPEQLLRIAASHNGGRLARTLTFASPFPSRAAHSTRTRGPSMVVDRDRVVSRGPPFTSRLPGFRSPCTQVRMYVLSEVVCGPLTGAWPGGSPAACERRRAHSVRTTRLRHLKHPRKDGDARASQDLRANHADCDCESDASAWCGLCCRWWRDFMGISATVHASRQRERARSAPGSLSKRDGRRE